MLSKSGMGSLGSLSCAANVIPDWYFGPWFARGSFWDAVNCCPPLVWLVSAIVGCKVAMDSFRDVGCAKDRTVMML